MTRHSLPTLSSIAAALCTVVPIPALAAPVVWITDGNSFWDIADNWSPSPPGIADDATIDVAGARTVTLRATGGPFSVNSLTVRGDDVLAISGGALALQGLSTADNLTGLSSLARLTQSGGVLEGAGTMTVTDVASLTGNGTHRGTGLTVLHGTTTLNGFNLDAGRVLRNEGTATLTGGMNLNPTDAAGAGTLQNAAGAVFDVRTFNLSITASSFATDPASNAAIQNAGTFRKSTNGNYNVNVRFLHEAGGTIDLQAGSFSFSAGGAFHGAVTLASGTALAFTGGTHSVGTGASFDGAGSWTLSGAGTVLDLEAPTTVESTFTMTGGTVRGADLVLAGPASLTISSSLGVMTGPGTTFLQGSATVSGGANNPFGLDAGRVLRNEGTMTLTGVVNLNRLDTPGAGRIENVAGALVDVRTFNQSIAASSFVGDTGVDARVTNAGIFRKSTTGSYGIAVPFINLALATLDVQSGSFNFSAGSTHDGAVILAQNAGLSFSGGAHSVGADATFTGPGTLTLAGAGTVLDLTAPNRIDSAFTMTGGTIRGADLDLHGPYALTISSSLGVLAGATTTRLLGDGTVSGGPNNTFGLDSKHVLRNEGTMTITGVLDLNRLSTTGAGRIDNMAGGLIEVKTFNQSIHATDWTATNPLDSGADARIDNAGIFRKNSTGTYSILVPFFNTGTVEVLSGGLRMQSFSNGGTVNVGPGGVFTVAGTRFINEGLIQGAGTVVATTGGVYNAGVIGPGNSPGHLTIDGDLEMADTGVLRIEVNGVDDHDLLTVTGDALLGGQLEIVRLEGYAPTLGDSFIVMTFRGRTGTTFDDVSFVGFAPGVRFDLTYRDQDILLGVAAIPEPGTWAMLLAGTGLLAWRARRRC